MRRSLMFVLILALILVLVSCGAVEKKDEGVQTPKEPEKEVENVTTHDTPSAEEEEETEELIPFVNDETIYNYGSIAELAQQFKEVGMTFMTSEILYIFHGKENVDGKDAEHIEMIIEDKQIHIWLDGEEFIKMTMDGEELTTIQGQWVALPFLSILDGFFHQEWENDWMDAKRSSVTRDLGAGPLKATHYEYVHPLVPAKIEIEVAEVAGKKIIIRYWQTYEEASSDEEEELDGSSVGWFFHRLIPR